VVQRVPSSTGRAQMHTLHWERVNMIETCTNEKHVKSGADWTIDEICKSPV
jgi:hypothetical protein